MKRPVWKAPALRLFGGLALIAFAGVALTGCEEPGAAAPAAPTSPAETATPAPLVDADETAPEVFDLTEATYWDGRPSLGGTWVAHPLVENPSRVRIINQEDGKSVEGALFRRDATLPGPAILLSYDAAKAIGVEPGLVTQIRIVALKDKEVLKAEREALAEEQAAPETAAAPAEEAPAVEAVAIPPAAPPPAEPTAETPEPVSIAAAPAAETPEPVSVAAAPAAPAVEPKAPATGAAPATPEPAIAEKTPEPAKSAPETPIVSGEPAVGDKSFKEAVASALSDTSSEQTATPATTLKNRFIQIATFKLANNAERTAAEFRVAGVPAEIRQGLASGERRMSRVLLGPFDQATAQSDAMRAARARGYKDAYYVDK